MPLSRKAELLSVCRLLNGRSSCSVGNAFDMFSYSTDLEPHNPAIVEGGTGRGEGEKLHLRAARHLAAHVLTQFPD